MRVVALLTTGLLVAGSTTGCSVITSLTGIELEPSYTDQQKAAYRASYELTMRGIAGDDIVRSITAAEWDGIYTAAAAVCKALDSHSVDELRQVMMDDLLSDANPDAVVMARKFANASLYAATAQGSFCPGAGS